MKPQLKEKWIAALRSSRYKQGKGELRSSDDLFCCLGVLCDVAGATWFQKESDRPWYCEFSANERYRPNALDPWLSDSAMRKFGLPKDIHRIAYCMNDGTPEAGDQFEGKQSFEEIADWLEAVL